MGGPTLEVKITANVFSFVRCFLKFARAPQGIFQEAKYTAGWRRSSEFPNLVVSNLVVYNFYAEVLFCTSLAPSFANLAVICTHLRSLNLRSFACFCVRPRLERPRLGNCTKNPTATRNRNRRNRFCCNQNRNWNDGLNRFGGISKRTWTRASPQGKHQHRRPEPLEPLHARTVAEPN